MSVANVVPAKPKIRFKHAWKALKRLLPLALAVFFIPTFLAFYAVCGLIDVLRNRKLNFSTLERYFFGNGVFTWLLSPFNLLMDLLTHPYRNRGVYEVADLPQAYQDEIQTLIDAAHNTNLVGQLQHQIDGQSRAMFFFKWYGKNINTSIDVPEFHQQFKFIRTIGVSVFNKRQSTSEHFGPLRVTLRVLYNINAIEDSNAYIQVGDCVHHWCDEKLFIFDDTLEHKSCNETNLVRYCLFVDILRPSLFPRLMSGILACLRVILLPVNSVFYRNWNVIKRAGAANPTTSVRRRRHRQSARSARQAVCQSR